MFHSGAGAGQAIEDGYILGRVLQDYLKARNTSHPYTLEDCLQTYQAIRAPRAEKVQVTSRQAGELYELRSEDVAGLSYEESLAIAKIKLADRMKWIWTEDVDMAYEKAIKRTDVQASML